MPAQCHHTFVERFANTVISSLLLKEQEVCPPWDLVPFSPSAGLGAGRKRTSSLEAERIHILILQSLVKCVPRGHRCWLCSGRAQ